MASSEHEGSCCVCGQVYTQRCSACGKADFALFLCAREHQKIVWFGHKRVCGEKAKPFRFPLLTSAELAKAKTLLYKPIQHEIRIGLPWVLALQSACFLDLTSLSQVPAALASLEEGRAHSFSSQQLSGGICTARSSFFYHSNSEYLAQAPPDNPYQTSVPLEQTIEDLMNPHTVLAFQAVELAKSIMTIDGNLPAFPVDVDWFIKLQHFAHIFSTIKYLSILEQKRVASTGDTAGDRNVDFNSYMLAIVPRAAVKIIELVTEAEPHVLPAVRETLALITEGTRAALAKT
ncbi:hypothetical protein JCM8547_007693 [Rhodosporidiobolus lusitaniae]